MLISVLSPYPEEISTAFEKAGDEWRSDHVLTADNDADFIISYGHRHIIKEPLVSQFYGRLINLHIAYLPWNRGADPNFWSFVEGTPKGVSIHLIDRGIDTGPILAQREMTFTEGTLATTYQALRKEMASLFIEAWPLIRRGLIDPRPQQESGSYHRVADKADLWKNLPSKFDTSIDCLQRLRVMLTN